MFIDILQGFLSLLSSIWQWLRTIVGYKDDRAMNKKSDWNNPYGLNHDYFQPQFYNPDHSLNTNLRQRGLPMDVDRSTNQMSQSSAVTLPRPFYAPVRQSPQLTNRSGHQPKQKQSLVDLLLEQQREAAVLAASAEPIVLPPQATSPMETIVESTKSEVLNRNDCTNADSNPPHSSPVSYIYEPPPIAPKLPANESAGLRGSRPLVKLNRMQFIAKMAKEGNDGARMGDYAPDSQMSSVDLSSIKGLLSSSSGAATEAVSAPLEEADANSSSSFGKARGGPRLAAYPTLSLNDLSLNNVIGGGGFGQVWKGTWGGTPVAVKLLSNLLLPAAGPGPSHPEHEQLLQAFEEEVSMLAQLRHPNICLFLGVCLEPPNRAIVTELVSRGSLWDCLRIPNLFQQKSLPWPVGILRRILEGTCRGLIYLHGHSPPIIHRDLKSANLLLDETFNVKICDFGLARLRDYNTVLTANVGTIHWMAPEVLTGNQYNESADMYSVGIVMWELFTGQCPYDGMKQVEVALSVVQKGLRPVIPTSCTTAQANLIRRCWDTDPAQRLSAEQLLLEVDSAFPVK